MTALTPFLFEEQHLVRTLMRADGPWFVLVDVCRVLEIGNPSDAARRLDEDEKGVDSIDTPGGVQSITIINESGLYSLILTSRKPAAKRFKKWVTAEVLPAIRKTGGYGQARPTLDYRGQDQALKLMERLKRDRNPTSRRVTHAMLAEILTAQGIEVPALEELGRDAPTSSDLLRPFWSAIAALEALGQKVDHSADPELIAVNLGELAARCKAAAIALTVDTTLRRALRQCADPPFLATKTVRSRITGGTIKCWVFRRTALDLFPATPQG